MKVPEHIPRTARFTVIEMLVLIGIVGVALGVALPFIRAARVAQRKVSCTNNLKQIGLALHTYYDTYNVFPANGLYFTTAQSNNPFVGSRSSRGSVFAKLQPLIESSPFYGSLSFELAGTPWGFEQQMGAPGLPGPKRTVASYPKTVMANRYLMPSLFCPSSNLDPYLDRLGNAAAVSCYAPSVGSQNMPAAGNWCADYPGNVFGTGPARYGMTTSADAVSGVFAKGHWAARFRDIEDGQSQVIAMGEILPNKSWHQSLGWLHANAFPAATAGPINFPVIGIGERGFPGAGNCGHYRNRQTSDAFRSRHKGSNQQGGAHFVMCDGSTQFVGEDIDYLTYQRLGDRRDGQPLGSWNQVGE